MACPCSRKACMRCPAWLYSVSVRAMELAPFIAKLRQCIRQSVKDSVDFRPRESIVAAQFGWAVGTVQQEHGFARRADHVDMRGAMIVRVDHDPQTAESQDGWHVPS